MNLEFLAFRFRVWIFAVFYLLGFLAPWEHFVPGRGTGSLWLAASALLARTGWQPLGTATMAVTFTAIFFCWVGAALRLWGTAHLGGLVMRDSVLHGDRVITAGPYRFSRNPLYLGSLLFDFGVAVLMPVTGAIFFLVATYLFQRMLISAEETFLSSALGEAYRGYKDRVPRFLPRFRAPNSFSSERPHWLAAVLVEIYPVGFALCFTVLAWRYNVLILIKCLIVCYGLSLVARALSPSSRRNLS